MYIKPEKGQGRGTWHKLHLHQPSPSWEAWGPDSCWGVSHHSCSALGSSLLFGLRWKHGLPWSGRGNHPDTTRPGRAGQDLREEPRQPSQPNFLYQWNKPQQIREWTDPSSHCESASQAALVINSLLDPFPFLCSWDPRWGSGGNYSSVTQLT